MNVDLTSKTDTQAALSIRVEAKLLGEIKRHVYDQHLRPRVKASGFRPGKAPDQIVERQLGSASAQSQVLDEALQETYSRAVREQSLNVVAPPEIKIVKFVPYTELEYTATVELLAPVKLGDYRSVRLPRPAAIVSAEEIDRTIEDLRRREATRLVTDQPAADGDEVKFDFTGNKDGQPVPGASATGQTLRLGSGDFIPGFETELVGLSAGAMKTFTITFPADYHESTLAGQAVEFSVKIESVTQLILPELDESFVATVGPFATVDQLRDDVAQRLAAHKEQAAGRQYEQGVIEAVVAQAGFSVPDALMRQELDRLKAELTQNLASSGLDLEKYLTLTKKTASQLEAELEPEARRRVGVALVLTEVAKAEQIKVTDEDVDAELDRLRRSYPDPQMQAQLDSPQTREEIFNQLMASRTVEALVRSADQPETAKVPTKETS